MSKLHLRGRQLQALYYQDDPQRIICPVCWAGDEIPQNHCPICNGNGTLKRSNVSLRELDDLYGPEEWSILGDRSPHPVAGKLPYNRTRAVGVSEKMLLGRSRTVTHPEPHGELSLTDDETKLLMAKLKAYKPTPTETSPPLNKPTYGPLDFEDFGSFDGYVMAKPAPSEELDKSYLKKLKERDEFRRKRDFDMNWSLSQAVAETTLIASGSPQKSPPKEKSLKDKLKDLEEDSDW